jgi:hypothetical protein
MTSRKSEKKLDLKVRRVLKTNVRGGIAKDLALVAVGGVVAASGDQAQSGLGPGPRSSSYGSRIPTDTQFPTQIPELPGGGFKVSG